MGGLKAKFITRNAITTASWILHTCRVRLHPQAIRPFDLSSVVVREIQFLWTIQGNAKVLPYHISRSSLIRAILKRKQSHTDCPTPDTVTSVVSRFSPILVFWSEEMFGRTGGTLRHTCAMRLWPNGSLACSPSS